jgi:hypothetical protein
LPPTSGPPEAVYGEKPTLSRSELLAKVRSQLLTKKTRRAKSVNTHEGFEIYQSDYNAGLAPSHSKHNPVVWDYCKMTMHQHELDYLKTRERSPTSLSMVRESIKQFQTATEPIHYDPEILNRAVDIVDAQLANLGTTEPISFKEMKDHVVSSSSAGFLFQGHTKGEAYSVANDIAQKHWRRIAKGKGIEEWLVLAATRPGMVTRGDIKARGVWNFPYPQLLREGRFAEALTTLINSQDATFFGWTVKWFKGASNLLTSLFGGTNGTSKGDDYSGFDTSVREKFIRIAFKLLWKRFDFSSFTAQEIREFKLNWQQIVEYFIKTPILLGSEVWLKLAGIPSGSYFTQLIGSIINFIWQIYGILSLMQRNGLWDMDIWDILRYIMVLGDDSLSKFLRKLNEDDLDYIAEAIRTGCGGNINRSKGFSRVHAQNEEDPSANPEFLGYHFCSQQGPTRDFLKTVEQVLYPERPCNTPSELLEVLLGHIWMTAPVNRRTSTWLRGIYYMVLSSNPESAPTCYPNWLLRQFKYALHYVPPIELPTEAYLASLYSSSAPRDLSFKVVTESGHVKTV